MSDEETPQAPGIVAAFAQPDEGEAPQRRRRGVGPDPMEMLRSWTPKTRLGRMVQSGQIINIGSIGALQAVPTAAVYCGTKFAVRAISDGLRQESRAIRITCVNPGVVESELAATITHAETQAAMADYRAIALQPADIARAVRQLIEAPQSVDTSEITIRPTASAN